MASKAPRCPVCRDKRVSDEPKPHQLPGRSDNPARCRLCGWTGRLWETRAIPAEPRGYYTPWTGFRLAGSAPAEARA